jgi:hypothetical protein
MHFSSPSCVQHAPLTLPTSIHRNNISWTAQILKLSIMQFSPSFGYFLPSLTYFVTWQPGLLYINELVWYSNKRTKSERLAVQFCSTACASRGTRHCKACFNNFERIRL